MSSLIFHGWKLVGWLPLSCFFSLVSFAPDLTSFLCVVFGFQIKLMSQDCLLPEARLEPRRAGGAALPTGGIRRTCWHMKAEWERIRTQLIRKLWEGFWKDSHTGVTENPGHGGAVL